MSTRLAQEQSYYPFGLQMAAISDKAIIIPASLYSAISSGNDYMEHRNFWTEKDASARAVIFFGSASAIANDRFQPTGISLYIEILGYVHNK